MGHTKTLQRAPNHPQRSQTIPYQPQPAKLYHNDAQPPSTTENYIITSSNQPSLYHNEPQQPKIISQPPPTSQIYFQTCPRYYKEGTKMRTEEALKEANIYKTNSSGSDISFKPWTCM